MCCSQACDTHIHVDLNETRGNIECGTQHIPCWVGCEERAKQGTAAHGRAVRQPLREDAEISFVEEQHQCLGGMHNNARERQSTCYCPPQNNRGTGHSVTTPLLDHAPVATTQSRPPLPPPDHAPFSATLYIAAWCSRQCKLTFSLAVNTECTILQTIDMFERPHLAHSPSPPSTISRSRAVVHDPADHIWDARACLSDGATSNTSYTTSAWLYTHEHTGTDIQTYLHTNIHTYAQHTTHILHTYTYTRIRMRAHIHIHTMCAL